MKQPITYVDNFGGDFVNEIAPGEVPADLATRKHLYLLVYPIPVEPSFLRPDNTEELNGGPISYESATIPRYVC